MNSYENVSEHATMLEKAKALSTIIASLVIPLAVALSGNWYSTAIKEREVQVRYVELAINILSQEPSEKNQRVRKWAIDIINHYSDVRIEAKTEQELLRERLSLRPESMQFVPQNLEESRQKMEALRKLREESEKHNQRAEDILKSIGR